VVQYGYAHAFNRARQRLTGQLPGNVRHSIGEAELARDLERSGLTERARFWVLRGISSSVVLLLTKSSREEPRPGPDARPGMVKS
jgi:hypothetical protein